ncbi:MAG: IPT/TIG domain-containing protein, partial [Planctomycetota bacterium]
MRITRVLPLLVACAALGCTEGDDTTVVQQVNAAPPTVTGIVPSSGPAAGGTTLTLSGSAFVSGATVEIGGTTVPAGNVTFVSSVELTVVTPAGTPGPALVTVTNPNGEAGALVGGFTYVGPPPTLL